MPATYTVEEQIKLDAWVNAIRTLARQHGVSHRIHISEAVKTARKTLATQTLANQVQESSRMAIVGGIPAEEMVAIRTLIFG